MAGRVRGVRPGDECEDRLLQAEEALREAYHLCCEEGFALGDWEKIAAYHDDFLEERPERIEMAGRVEGVRPPLTFTGYMEAADWYVMCLEDVLARRPVRGLAEAKAAYESAREGLTA